MKEVCVCAFVHACVCIFLDETQALLILQGSALCNIDKKIFTLSFFCHTKRFSFASMI